jgi:folate-binding protein YgfZ
MSVSAGVRALEEGTGFAYLAGWRAIAVTGSDSVGWLNDLVTNRVDDIGPNELRRTLFLDRTGRVRADVHVGALGDPANPAGFVIHQDPVQPAPIEDLVAPYVLSSDVELRESELGLAVINDGIKAVQFMAWPGPRDRIGHFPVQEAETETGLAGVRQYHTVTEATPEDAEAFRIRRGAPRFGVDFDDQWLPSEVGFDDLIDTTKGCFLGQESVAKVRNLGHPPRLVLPFEAPDRVYPMAQITAAGEPVGRVTSVAPLDEDSATACIGWVRWDARDADLAVDGGFALSTRRPGPIPG